jgi:hypothetical protein
MKFHKEISQLVDAVFNDNHGANHSTYMRFPSGFHCTAACGVSRAEVLSYRMPTTIPSVLDSDSYSTDVPYFGNMKLCSYCGELLGDCQFGIPARLRKCQHNLQLNCLKKVSAYIPQCPTCEESLETLVGRGKMPSGRMTITPCMRTFSDSGSVSAIQIEYYFPSGKQRTYHSHPRHGYLGLTQILYLRENLWASLSSRSSFPSWLVFPNRLR